MREKEFETQFEKLAALHNMKYFKIPDVHGALYAAQKHVPAAKRPFDGILVTENKIFLIELKVGSARPKVHQSESLEAANIIHKDCGYVVRKLTDKYRIEKWRIGVCGIKKVSEKENVCYECKRITELFNFFGGAE